MPAQLHTVRRNPRGVHVWLCSPDCTIIYDHANPSWTNRGNRTPNPFHIHGLHGCSYCPVCGHRIDADPPPGTECLLHPDSPCPEWVQLARATAVGCIRVWIRADPERTHLPDHLLAAYDQVTRDTPDRPAVWGAWLMLQDPQTD